MTKERIKKHQTYSIAPVALLFMVSMMVCPHFFTKEFCSLLFIGGVSVLLVCSIVAQVYLYVRYKDNTRLSWLWTIYILILLISLCRITFTSLSTSLVCLFLLLIYTFTSELSIDPRRYKGDEFKQLAMFSIYWISTAGVFYIFYDMFFVR